jgi:hypothetical protein
MFISELNKANKNNALFHSAHEGFAVLYEEYEEMTEQINIVRMAVEQMWGDVRRNQNKRLVINTNCLQSAVTETIREAVQLGAMCEKLLYFLSKDEKKEGGDA